VFVGDSSLVHMDFYTQALGSPNYYYHHYDEEWTTSTPYTGQKKEKEPDHIHCKEHPRAQLIDDYHTGDMICKECSFVVASRMPDDGPEWRTFADDAYRGRACQERVGAPSDFEETFPAAVLDSFAAQQQRPLMQTNTPFKQQQQQPRKMPCSFRSRLDTVDKFYTAHLQPCFSVHAHEICSALLKLSTEEENSVVALALKTLKKTSTFDAIPKTSKYLTAVIYAIVVACAEKLVRLEFNYKLIQEQLARHFDIENKKQVIKKFKNCMNIFGRLLPPGAVPSIQPCPQSSSEGKTATDHDDDDDAADASAPSSLRPAKEPSKRAADRPRPYPSASLSCCAKRVVSSMVETLNRDLDVLSSYLAEYLHQNLSSTFTFEFQLGGAKEIDVSEPLQKSVARAVASFDAANRFTCTQFRLFLQQSTLLFSKFVSRFSASQNLNAIASVSALFSAQLLLLSLKILALQHHAAAPSVAAATSPPRTTSSCNLSTSILDLPQRPVSFCPGDADAAPRKLFACSAAENNKLVELVTTLTRSSRGSSITIQNNLQTFFRNYFSKAENLYGVLDRNPKNGVLFFVNECTTTSSPPMMTPPTLCGVGGVPSPVVGFSC
jgi:transcription initiation factor TFIIIB Brf1 subunit/transcription initiation factor TFIIB